MSNPLIVWPLVPATSKDGAREMLLQSLSSALPLQWHLTFDNETSNFSVPCDPLLPASLLPLRDSVLTLTMAPTAPWRTEPLIKYVGAIQVALRQCPLDRRALLRHEQQVALHYLSRVYHQLAGPEGPLTESSLTYRRAAARALTLSHYSSDHCLLLNTQCQVLALALDTLNQGKDNTGPDLALVKSTLLEMSHVYERLGPKLTDPQCQMVARIGEGYWRAHALIQAAPEPIALAKEANLANGHVRQNKVMRERHYKAALACLQEPVRVLKSLELSKGPCRALMKNVEVQLQALEATSKKVSEARGAYDASTWAFAQEDGQQEEEEEKNLMAPLSMIALPTGPPLDTREDQALDTFLLQAADAWSATDAAARLNQQQQQPKKVPLPMQQSLPHVMNCLLGEEANRPLINNPKRARREWTLVLMTALTERGHWLQGQTNLLDRDHDLARIQAMKQRLADSLH